MIYALRIAVDRSQGRFMEAGAVEKLAELLKAEDGLERDAWETREIGKPWENHGRNLEFIGRLGKTTGKGGKTRERVEKKIGNDRERLENMWR